ncbi:MAG: hypothetical protein QM679_06635 [Patulibacter sp.]
MSNDLLQSIGKDLVDKKLWPVALALAAATVAVPVVVGSGESSAAPTSATAPVATTPGLTDGEPLALTASTTTGLSKAPKVSNKELDPFAVRNTSLAWSSTSTAVGTPEASTGTGSATGASGAATASVDGAASTGSTDAAALLDGATATPTPTPTPSTSSSSKSVKDGLTLLLQIGTEPAKLLEQQERKTVFPDETATDPLFVYSHKSKAGSAVFTISSNATVTAPEGACSPSQTVCDTLTLAVGDRAIITPNAEAATDAGTTPDADAASPVTITIVKVGTETSDS